MNHAETANRAGVNLADLDWLLRGDVSGNVASRLGLPIADIEYFIRGSATANMTRRLGLQAISAAEELAQAAGPQGAIGIVIGLLMSI